jgi:class 3 adenylate cyclase/tetratricopeptide (TPR) repeat protein
MREERKVVSALFADLVGSTELTERLDPEDAREVIGVAIERMVHAVERFGGTVKDLAGDGVLALFGAPVAHEDDAERAVLAGLDIVGAAGAGPEALSARVGIETGLVVLGPVGAGARVEYGATGDAVNTAARLQSHALEGTVLVGEATQRALGDRFTWGDERRLEVKGKSDRVKAFQVVGVRERPRAATDARMVGREPELERALDLSARALAGGGGFLLVVGEPGIGKSRLAAELRRRLEHARWLEGACVSFGRSTPFLPLREPIREALAVARGEMDPTDASYLDGILGTARTADRSPESIQLRTLEALRALFARVADGGPTVIAIEDVHWADPSTIRAIERLRRSLPALFLLTGREREDGTERLRGLGDVIELGVLSSDAERELLDGLLLDRSVPRDTYRRLVETAGGNPFFLGELARSLVDRRELGPDELPTTIEKVILARLDVLDTEPRDVLTAASVLGRAASTVLLERLVDGDPRPAIDELRRHDLVEEASRADQLVFRHALIQEVAYRTLLRKRQRELHARAARAIGELWTDRLDEHLALLAYHHHRAGEIDEARACHARAAERAERLHAVSEALEHLSRAIALAEEGEHTPAERDVAELLLARARIEARTGDAVGAVQDLEGVLAANVDRDVEVRAHDELGFALAGAADYRRAVPHLETALELATAGGDRVGEVSAMSRLAIVQVNRLDFESALEYGRGALALAESLGDEGAEATAMDAMKQVALQTGDFDTVDRLVDRLSEIHRRSDDLWYLQFALDDGAWADLLRGFLDRAATRIDEGIAINRRIGDRGNEPLGLTALAWMHRASGDYGEAMAEGRRAFELAQELDHTEWVAWGGVTLGSTLVELEAVEEADEVLRTAIEAAERAGADLHLVRALGLGAYAAWRSGEDERAAELADRARAMYDLVRVHPPRGHVMGADAVVALARVRIHQGTIEAADGPLRGIVEACEACGATAGAAAGRGALAELALRAGDVAAAVEESARAVDSAARRSLPTTWRARAVFAEALSAAAEHERAAAEVERAEAQVATLAETIDDVVIRTAFVAGAARTLSAGRGPG